MGRLRIGAPRSRAVLLTASILGFGLAFVAISNERAVGIRAVKRHTPSPAIEVIEAWTTRGRLVVVYANPNDAKLSIDLNPGLAPLGELRAGALALANAGYFTREHRPTGLLVSEGEILHPFVEEAGAAGSGVLVVQDGKVELLERDAVGRRAFDRAELAIQAGPRVIEPDGSYGIHGDDGMRANRTVVGYDRRGRFALAVVYDRDGGIRRGPTLFELQHLLGPDGLGKIDDDLAFQAALNLDGGPSTGLYLRPPAPRLDLSPSNRVVSVLSVHGRREAQ